MGGVGIRNVDAIGILAGSEAGIGADHITLAVCPADEVVVIIRRRGGAGGLAGGRFHRLGSQTYGTADGRHIADGHIGFFSPGAGEGYVLVGHGEGAVGHLGVGRGPAGEGVAGKGGLIFHGHGVTVGAGLRGGGRGGSGGGCTGVGIGHLEVHLLPDCIERIGALVVHDDGSVGQIFRFGSSTSGGPAEELVAGTGEAKFRIALQGDGFVVQVILLRRDSSGAAVGIVGQGRECGLVAPDGIEGDVGVMDGNLVAGLIDGAAGGGGTPAQEHLALGGDQVGSGHDIGIGTVCIGLGILRLGAGAAVGVISDFEGLVAGVVGIEGNIVVDQGVEVEGGVDVVRSISTPHSPASPGVALGHFLFGSLGREVSLVDLGAVRNGNVLGFVAGHGQIGSAHKLRRGPLGVDGDILGRHSAGEDIGVALAQLIVIPALELVLRRNTRRTGGSVRNIGDICLIQFGDCLHQTTVVVEINVVAVAVVEELGACIVIAPFGAICFI